MTEIVETSLPRDVASESKERLLFDAYMSGRYGEYRLLYDYKTGSVVISFKNKEDGSAFVMNEDDKKFIEKFLKPYTNEIREEAKRRRTSEMHHRYKDFETLLGRYGSD